MDVNSKWMCNSMDNNNVFNNNIFEIISLLLLIYQHQPS